MPVNRVSIGQAMMVVALAAVNLTVTRAAPPEVATFPTIWIFLGSIDFLIVWKLILARPLRAFHYTFLIVFIIAFLVLANLVATERFLPLDLLVRWYQHLTGEKTISIARGPHAIGEFWTVCFLSAVLGWGIGLVAAWLERRRGWDIAAFFRGALVGYPIACLLAIIEGAVWGREPASPVRLIGRLVLMGVCLILGGVMGLSRLRSRDLFEARR
jgi:hypothetical protein